MEYLKINLMVSEGLVELKLKGKLASKKKITDKEIERWDAYAERQYIIGKQHCTEYDEKWDIVKPDGKVLKLSVMRRILNFKGKKEEFLFEDFFSDKIVYEDYEIEDLKKFGEVSKIESYTDEA